MVTAPIADNGVMFVNLVNTKETNTNKNAGEPDFARTMREVNDRQDTAQTTVEPKVVKTNAPIVQKKQDEPKIQSDMQQSKDSATSREVTSEKKTEKSSTPEEVQNPVTEETKDAVKDAARDILDRIAEELDMDEEDIINAMNCLGLSMVDLLNADDMTALFVKLSGSDMLGLVTNEELYTCVQNLTSELQESLDGLLEEFGITEDVLKQACEQIKMEMQSVDVASFEQNLVNMDVMPQSPDVVQEPVIMVQKENVKDYEKESGTVTETEVPQEEDEVVNVPTEQVTEDSDTSGEDAKMKQPEQRNIQVGTHKKDETVQTHVTQNSHTAFQNDFSLDMVKAAADGDKLYQTNTQDIMKQIMDYMSVKVKEDVTEMEMQLHPSSLGTVNLQLTARDGAVTAQFTVQNEAVKSAMETQVVQLKEELENQGVKVEAVEVTLASHGFERNLNEQNHEQTEQEAQNKVKANRRRIINLNEYDTLESIEAGEDDATRIAMEMMSSNGNSLDMLA